MRTQEECCIKRELFEPLHCKFPAGNPEELDKTDLPILLILLGMCLGSY